MTLPFLRLIRRACCAGLWLRARFTRLVWSGLLLATLGTSIPAQSGTVLVVGDSISAAYGMDLHRGWVSLLGQRLKQQSEHHTVVNASISGDTTAGGVRRLPSLLREHQPSLVLIELGGNDGLRGYPIDQMRTNLLRMTRDALAANAQVLLLAMEVPPNLGRRYSTAFRESFAHVAEQAHVSLAPFILDGIATDRALMQEDGIHPKASAQALILENIWPHVLPLIDREG